MADDIDDLLDNFEDNYHKKGLKSKKKRAGIITDDWDSSDSENSSKQYVLSDYATLNNIALGKL